MDAAPPAVATVDHLTAVIRREWSLDLGPLTYEPKGGGAYHWRGQSHFVTVDDLDTKPWIGRDRDATYAGLEAAYEIAWRFEHENGLVLVVAPRPTDDGAFAVRLDERYSVSVFPLVEGRAGEWGETITVDERAGLLRELTRLHSATSGVPIRRRSHELFERDDLNDAFAHLHEPWDAGPFSERARQAIIATEDRLRERLDRFDELAAILDALDTPPVVTHGEPHPGNLIHTAAGPRLIDWDTVALADPERDLWMLADGDIDANPTAAEFWRLSWTLSDIASFTSLFRHTQPRTAWAELKWGGYLGLLEGADSAPYGPA